MKQLYFLTITLFFILLFNACRHKTNLAVIGNTLSPKDSLYLQELLDSLNSTSILNTDSLRRFSNHILNQFPSNKDLINIKIAHIHYSHSNYILSQFYFKNAADYYRFNKLPEKQAEQYINIGVTKELSGDYTGAIEDYYFALNIFDSLNIPTKKSYAYNNIGIVYQQLGNYPESLEFYKKSLQIAKELNLKQLEANRYNNIASIYEEGFDNIDSAFCYYSKAHKIYTADSSYLRSPIIENNIGYMYFRKHQYKKADSIYTRALSYSIAQQLNNSTIYIYRNQAELLLKKGDFNSAENKIKLAISTAKKYSYKEMEIKSLEVLINIYESQGDYKNVNMTLRQLQLLKNKLSGIETQNSINRLVITYQLKEKEHRIQVLELKTDIQSRKLWQLWLLIIALLFLLSGLFLVFRLQRKNNRMQIQQMQHDISDYISQIEEIQEDKEKRREQLQQQKIKEKQSKKTVQIKLKEFNLSEREEDVLLLIAQGYKNAEIAEKLFLSVNTIKTHTKNIFIKLDVRNRIEASRKTQII